MSLLIIASNKVLVRDDDNDDEINGHIDYNNHNDDNDNGQLASGRNVHCENNEYNINHNEDDNDHNDQDGENDDDDDQGAGGDGQAGRNVPREPAPIITSVVNPRPPLHLLRSDYIDHLYDDFHCSNDDEN